VLSVLPSLVLDFFFLTRPQIAWMAAYVTRHDKYGILEVNRAAVTVGKASIIQYLQQNVKDIG